MNSTCAQGTGEYFIKANGVLIWSREGMECFPEITKLQLVRHGIAPDKLLGHSIGKKKEY
ncbi:hypothetical protein [Negadavirga shengliensis]|uniref:Uncharacterized protein n=1 Tax=Negadavirga shengliensis TaxID=1389218 RepID=A0ABV9SX59_9BACT